MASHSSATTRRETPHVNRTSRTSTIIKADTVFSQTHETNETDSSDKIETLAEIICRVGDESAVALLVLMGMLQNSLDPKVLANTAKHFAFTRCGELNVYGIIESQIAMLESELLAGDTVQS